MIVLVIVYIQTHENKDVNKLDYPYKNKYIQKTLVTSVNQQITRCDKMPACSTHHIGRLRTQHQTFIWHTLNRFRSNCRLYLQMLWSSFYNMWGGLKQSSYYVDNTLNISPFHAPLGFYSVLTTVLGGWNYIFYFYNVVLSNLFIIKHIYLHLILRNILL